MLSSLLIIQRNILLRLVCKVGYTVYSSLNKIDPLVPLRLYDVIDRGFLISLGDVVSRHVSRHWPSITSYHVTDRVFLIVGLTSYDILLLLKTANLSNSNSADSQFLNESNTILPLLCYVQRIHRFCPCYLSELLHLYWQSFPLSSPLYGVRHNHAQTPTLQSQNSCVF